MHVFRITSTISEQVFPFKLDQDHHKFLPLLRKIAHYVNAMGEAKAAGGVGGKLKAAGYALGAGFAFVRLYALPVIDNNVPTTVRLTPAW